MEVTKILEQEHQVILKEILELNAKLKSRPGENLKEIKNHIDFFKRYADKFHHRKEEEIYFKWMVREKAELENGPIMCMISEHEQGRVLLNESKVHIINFEKNQNPNEIIEMRKKLDFFSSILTNHIHKEDEVLYKMAEEINNNTQNGDRIMLPLFLKANEENQYEY